MEKLSVSYSTISRFLLNKTINRLTKISFHKHFNDAIESFCRIVNYNKTVAEVDGEQLTLKLLSAGPQRLLVDKSAKIICQFLA